MSDCSQHLGAFLYFESVVTEINQFFVFLRNGGSEYDERTFLVLTGFRNQVDVFFVMYLCDLAIRVSVSGVGVRS